MPVNPFKWFILAKGKNSGDFSLDEPGSNATHNIVSRELAVISRFRVTYGSNTETVTVAMSAASAGITIPYYYISILIPDHHIYIRVAAPTYLGMIKYPISEPMRLRRSLILHPHYGWNDRLSCSLSASVFYLPFSAGSNTQSCWLYIPSPMQTTPRCARTPHTQELHYRPSRHFFPFPRLSHNLLNLPKPSKQIV